MCHIYRYFRNDTRHFFRYPGGRGSGLGLSIYPYHSPAPAASLSPQTRPRRRGVIWCYRPPLEYIEFIVLLYVRSFPLLYINSEHFRKYERNKNEILWRSLIYLPFCPWDHRHRSPIRHGLHRLRLPFLCC